MFPIYGTALQNVRFSGTQDWSLCKLIGYRTFQCYNYTIKWKICQWQIFFADFPREGKRAREEKAGG